MVSYVACMDCHNNKTRLMSYSRFMNVSYVAYTDCTCECRGSMKRGKGGLDD